MKKIVFITVYCSTIAVYSNHLSAVISKQDPIDQWTRVLQTLRTADDTNSGQEDFNRALQEISHFYTQKNTLKSATSSDQRNLTQVEKVGYLLETLTTNWTVEEKKALILAVINEFPADSTGNFKKFIDDFMEIAPRNDTERAILEKLLADPAAAEIKETV